jgi:hypothetical protein
MRVFTHLRFLAYLAHSRGPITILNLHFIPHLILFELLLSSKLFSPKIVVMRILAPPRFNYLFVNLRRFNLITQLFSLLLEDSILREAHYFLIEYCFALKLYLSAVSSFLTSFSYSISLLFALLD